MRAVRFDCLSKTVPEHLSWHDLSSFGEKRTKDDRASHGKRTDTSDDQSVCSMLIDILQ